MSVEMAPLAQDIMDRSQKKSLFLHSTQNSTIFESRMSEAQIIAETDISPEGKVAKLSHRDKIIRAMHGGSKPEVRVEGEELDELEALDLSGLLGEESNHTKDPKELAKKLSGPLRMNLRPFKEADKGREHIVLVNEEDTELAKVDKLPVDDDLREDKARTYTVLRELFPGRLPASRDFKEVGETGVVVEKLKTHPRFEEARKAAKNGNPALWNEITKNYFSDVLDEANAMRIDLWNSIDADERDNFITDEKGNQVFVDDIWVEGREILAAKNQIFTRMKEHPEKYSPDQQTRVIAAVRDLESSKVKELQAA